MSGFFLLVVGVAITVGTYVWADHRGGGTYIVSWGPMVAGLITLIRGLLAGGRVGFRGRGGSWSGSGGGRRGAPPSWYTPAPASTPPAWGWQSGPERAGQAAIGQAGISAPPVASAGWPHDPSAVAPDR